MIAGLAGAIAASGLALLWLPHFHPSTDPVTVQLEVLTDVHTPAAGVSVRLSDGTGNEQVHVTDATGRTDWYAAMESATLDVAFRETVLPDGIGVGQRFQLPVPVFDDYSELGPQYASAPCSLEHARTIPVAVPVVVTPGDGTDERDVWAEGRTAMWSILTPPFGPSYRFQAFVAPLASGTAVASTAAYHGLPQSEETYLAGLTIGSRGALLTGTAPFGAQVPSGFAAVLHCDRVIPANITDVTVDAFHFRTAPAPATQPGQPISQPPPLSVTMLVYDSSRSIACVLVDGYLPPGWLLLALRPADGTPGTLTMLDSTPPSFGGATGSSLLALDHPSEADVVEWITEARRTTTLPLVGNAASVYLASDASAPAMVGLPRGFQVQSNDCAPQPAGGIPDWTCTVPTGSSSTGCPPAEQGEKTCDSFPAPTGPKQCGTPGSSTERRRARTESKTVSVELDGPGGSTFAGGFTTETTSEWVNSHSFQPGEHGLGQCYQTWSRTYWCAAAVTEVVHRVRVWRDFPGPTMYDITPCADTKTVTRGCYEITHSQEVCSRTPAP